MSRPVREYRYGTRYDGQIRALTMAGASSYEIGAQLKLSVGYCRQRAYAIGLEAELRANGQRNRRSPQSGGVNRGSLRPFRAMAMGSVEFDHSVSNIIHTIRPRRPVDDVATDHALACLHLRGLTLPDLEDCFGIPPVQAVAAIRRAML